LQRDFYNNIKDNLKEFIEKEKINEKIAALVQRRLFNYVINLTLRWIDEIFADVFAIRVLGPAFHLSYLELEQILTSDIKRNRSFSATHPADDFRFKIHAKWLSESGWDNTMENRVPIISENLNKCKELDINLFEINCTSPLEGEQDLENKLHSWMLQEFDKMIVKVEEELSAKLEDFDNPIDDFKKNDSLVTACLEHGVVPSTGYNEKKERCRPEPTTILNSGFFFYLGGMDPLLGKVKSGDSKIDKRINYGKRLNQWLTKAIEDWQFLLWKDKL